MEGTTKTEIYWNYLNVKKTFDLILQKELNEAKESWVSGKMIHC